MRLTLDPQPVQVEFAAPDGAPADGDQAPPRLVGGLIVPFGQTAMVGGRLVEFAAGSIQPRDHVPLVLGHDLDRPIGVMATSASGSAGLSGVFAVDLTPDGDVAIAQARSGSRRGLSAGVDVLEATEDDAGRLLVSAGELVEVSQVTLAAYTDAAISTIAAQADQPQGEDQAMTDSDQPADRPDTEARQTAEAVDRRQPPVIVTAAQEPPLMRLGEYVQTLIQAERGNQAARQRIEAALTREVVGTNPGVVPIAYVQGIIDSLEAPRTLFDAFGHADLPPAGMTLRRPEVTARPGVTGWLPDDTATMPSSAITLGTRDVPVEQWAFGVSASVALVERSSPSFVEEAFRQMLNHYYREAEGKIAAELEGIAAPAGAPSTIGAASAAYMAAYGDWPNVLVAGSAAYGKIVDALGLLRYSSGSADATGSANIAGVTVVASGNVTPTDAWVMRRDALEVRESSPIRLTVSDVTSLSLEIGVTSFFALCNLEQTIGGIAGAVRVVGFTPPVSDALASSSGRSKS